MVSREHLNAIVKAETSPYSLLCAQAQGEWITQSMCSTNIRGAHIWIVERKMIISCPPIHHLFPIPFFQARVLLLGHVSSGPSPSFKPYLLSVQSMLNPGTQPQWNTCSPAFRHLVYNLANWLVLSLPFRRNRRSDLFTLYTWGAQGDMDPCSFPLREKKIY